jgi:hypothetical protein
MITYALILAAVASSAPEEEVAFTGNALHPASISYAYPNEIGLMAGSQAFHGLYYRRWITKAWGFQTGYAQDAEMLDGTDPRGKIFGRLHALYRIDTRDMFSLVANFGTGLDFNVVHEIITQDEYPYNQTERYREQYGLVVFAGPALFMHGKYFVFSLLPSFQFTRELKAPVKNILSGEFDISVGYRF